MIFGVYFFVDSIYQSKSDARATFYDVQAQIKGSDIERDVGVIANYTRRIQTARRDGQEPNIDDLIRLETLQRQLDKNLQDQADYLQKAENERLGLND